MAKKSKKREENIIKDITETLGNIVRHSLNNEFRDKCFELMDVDCTKDFEEEVKKRLQTAERQGTKIINMTDTELLTTHTTTIQAEKTPQTSQPTQLAAFSPMNSLGTQGNEMQRFMLREVGWNCGISASGGLSSATLARYKSSSQPTRSTRFNPYGTLGQASLSQLVQSPHSRSLTNRQSTSQAESHFYSNARTRTIPDVIHSGYNHALFDTNYEPLSSDNEDGSF